MKLLWSGLLELFGYARNLSVFSHGICVLQHFKFGLRSLVLKGTLHLITRASRGYWTRTHAQTV